MVVKIALFTVLYIATTSAFSVQVFQTNPATTEANLDSYNFGMIQKDSSAYWFSNWYLDNKGAVKAAYVACKYCTCFRNSNLATKTNNEGTCCPQRYKPEMTYGTVSLSGTMVDFTNIHHLCIRLPTLLNSDILLMSFVTMTNALLVTFSTPHVLMMAALSMIFGFILREELQSLPVWISIQVSSDDTGVIF